MKKFICLLACALVFTLCGCEMDNTPTKRVEGFLTKYQTLDAKVLEDLDNTLDKDTSLDDSMKKEYRDFMKKHYQDLTYEIKNETIDGDNATVEAQITVKDYSDIVTNAESYRIDNKDEFTDENGNYNDSLFTRYRLDKLKEAKSTISYTINFNLTKKKDEWVLDDLSSEDMNKINGLYTE